MSRALFFFFFKEGLGMVKNMTVADFIRGFWAEYIIILDLSLKNYQVYYALYCCLPIYDTVQHK